MKSLFNNKYSKVNIILLCVLMTFMIVFIMSGCDAYKQVISNANEDNSVIKIARRAKNFNDIKKELYIYKILETEGMVGKTADSNSMSKEDSEGTYSKTNNRESSIDEGDIVKTDGSYIYTVYGNSVKIIKADKGNMSIADTIEIEKGCFVDNMFIEKNKIVLICQIMNYPDLPNVEQRGNEEINFPRNDYTSIRIYDTTDKKKIKEIRTIDVSGTIKEARKNNNYMYFVSEEFMYADENDKYLKQKDLLPLRRDSKFGNKVNCIEPTQVIICPNYKSNTFTTISVLDLNDNKEITQESYFGEMKSLYMNENSAYLAFNKFDENDPYGEANTYVVGMKYNKENFTIKGEAVLEGQTLNLFSMDEYKGYFRIATTEEEKLKENGEKLLSSSNLYVLDSNMKVVGHIDNIAKGEKIYSARLSGNNGFLVTFKNVDPFFTLDLSDPTSPKIIGKLKIPGFSNYLHPVGKNKMIGIGRDTYEIYKKNDNGELEVIGARTEGIKISLFDFADFANPKEIDKMIVGDKESYSNVEYNHKDLMCNPDGKTFGFMGELINKEDNKITDGIIFDVENDKINLKCKIEPLATDEAKISNEPVFNSLKRFVYIDGIYYAIVKDKVKSFEIASDSTNPSYIKVISIKGN